MEYFRYYQNLGFNNPYYIADRTPFVLRRKFTDIVEELECERKIDPTSVIEILNKNYILGDRTIIQGVNRTPWQAKPDDDLTYWQYSQPPLHDKKLIPEEEIAIILFEKICNEIKGYINSKKNVGVLLSGGMDSRMVAGALDYLMKTEQLINVSVTGLTWGNDGSRDVVYAKEISRRLGWNWKHYVVNANVLKNNVMENADNGCEYSPVHLHAIPQIRDDNDFDVILAGSYGDSVGRAEYSGKKVTSLTPINKSIRNVAGLINKDVYNLSKPHIEEDVNAYHRLFPAKEPYMQNEMDYELHYMRRMLNPCMELLTEKSEFYQIFTTPDVFGFMWSVDPIKRNDMVYKHMMKEFKTNLSDIPWARTGLPYMAESGISDSFTKKHHSYEEIIEHELLDELTYMIKSSGINKLGIFNVDNIYQLIKLIKKYPNSNLYYGEKVIWLASLSLFIDKFGIELISQTNSSNKKESFSNRISLLSDYFSYKTKSFIVKTVKK